jgi:hypothetical protein
MAAMLTWIVYDHLDIFIPLFTGNGDISIAVILSKTLSVYKQTKTNYMTMFKGKCEIFHSTKLPVNIIFWIKDALY